MNDEEYRLHALTRLEGVEDHHIQRALFMIDVLGDQLRADFLETYHLDISDLVQSGRWNAICSLIDQLDPWSRYWEAYGETPEIIELELERIRSEPVSSLKRMEQSAEQKGQFSRMAYHPFWGVGAHTFDAILATNGNEQRLPRPRSTLAERVEAERMDRLQSKQLSMLSASFAAGRQELGIPDTPQDGDNENIEEN